MNDDTMIGGLLLGGLASLAVSFLIGNQIGFEEGL